MTKISKPASKTKLGVEGEVGDENLIVECLPSTHKALVLILNAV